MKKQLKYITNIEKSDAISGENKLLALCQIDLLQKGHFPTAHYLPMRPFEWLFRMVSYSGWTFILGRYRRCGMTRSRLASKIPEYILDCPVYGDWTEYKGETYFAFLNYERSLKARRPMIDLFYCATEAMNGTAVIKTVQYSAKHFKKSKLAIT